MERLIHVKVEPLDEGGFLATSDELPGLIAQGRTIGETLEIAAEVAPKVIESHLAHDIPLPFELTEPASMPLEFSLPVAV